MGIHAVAGKRLPAPGAGVGAHTLKERPSSTVPFHLDWTRVTPFRSLWTAPQVEEGARGHGAPSSQDPDQQPPPPPGGRGTPGKGSRRKALPYFDTSWYLLLEGKSCGLKKDT